MITTVFSQNSHFPQSPEKDMHYVTYINIQTRFFLKQAKKVHVSWQWQLFCMVIFLNRMQTLYPITANAFDQWFVIHKDIASCINIFFPPKCSGEMLIACRIHCLKAQWGNGCRNIFSWCCQFCHLWSLRVLKLACELDHIMIQLQHCATWIHLCYSERDFGAVLVPSAMFYWGHV